MKKEKNIYGFLLNPYCINFSFNVIMSIYNLYIHPVTFQPLDSSSTFPGFPFLLILVSSVSLWLCFRFYLRSPRTLRWTIAILYRDHKKARERFWYETQKMQLDTDLHRYFKDLNKNRYTPFAWYLYFLYLSSAGSIVRLSTHDEVCKIEPAQARLGEANPSKSFYRVAIQNGMMPLRGFRLQMWNMKNS